MKLKQCLIVRDYSQMELRVMSLFSEDPAMVKILRDRQGDIHTATSLTFKVPRDPLAKNLNFGLLFGGQYRMLANFLTDAGSPTTEEQAKEYIATYDLVHPGVRAKREAWVQEHENNGSIRMFLGRKRELLDPDFSNDYGRHRAETQLANNAVQGTAQDFLKAAVIRSDPLRISPDRHLSENPNFPREHRLYLKDRARDVDRFRRRFSKGGCVFLLQIHDEIMFRCLLSAAAECSALLAEIMSWRHYFPPWPPYRYSVPLVSEGGVGQNWKEAKSKTALFRDKVGFEHWEKFGVN